MESHKTAEGWNVGERSTANNFLLKWRTDGFRLTVRPEGETNLYTTPEFKQVTLRELEANPELRLLHVDLSQSTFFDSTFCGVIVGLVKRLNARDVPSGMYLTLDDRNLKRMLEIQGLDRFFTIVGSEDEELDWETILQERYERRLQQIEARKTAEIFRGLGHVAKLIHEGVEPEAD